MLYFFFFNDTATTEIYTLSLHDALPIWATLGDTNAGGFSNPEFDKLAEGIKSCASLDQCKNISAQLQKTLSQQLPYVLLFDTGDRKSTRLNSSHANISYAVFCLKKKKHH